MPSVYASCLDPDHYNIYFEMVVPDRTIDVVARTQLKNEFKNVIDQLDPHPNPKRCGPESRIRALSKRGRVSFISSATSWNGQRRSL